jgi:hypothetical protein
MRRVLALVGAVALVVAAVVVRRALDDDASGPGSTGGDRVVAACAPELEDACRANARIDEVRVLDPADAIEAAVAGEVDAWVTLDPWPAMALQDHRDDFFGQTALVASSPLVLAVAPNQFGGTCSTAATWECVTDEKPRQVSLPSLDTTLGPLVFGWAVTDWNTTARDGQPFASQEFDLPEFRDFERTLDAGSDDPILEAIQFFPARSVAIGITDAAYREEIEPSRQAGSFTRSTATAAASVAVVVVGPAAERVAGEPGFHRSLTEDGWTLDTTTGSTGLPSAGVLFALQEEFG